MFGLIIALRDAVLTAALAWVGVCAEARGPAEQACRGEQCETAPRT